MKSSTFLLTVAFLVVLSGCTAEKIPDDWVEYKSATLGISFMHPPEYQNAEAEQEVLLLQTGSIIVQNAYLRQEQPISPFIIVMRTSDVRILEKAGQYHPLEKRSINNHSVWFYRMDGMASPEGYIFNDGNDWVSVEFVGFSEQLVIDRILQSVQITPVVKKE